MREAFGELHEVFQLAIKRLSVRPSVVFSAHSFAEHVVVDVKLGFVFPHAEPKYAAAVAKIEKLSIIGFSFDLIRTGPTGKQNFFDDYHEMRLVGAPTKAPDDIRSFVSVIV